MWSDIADSVLKEINYFFHVFWWVNIRILEQLWTYLSEYKATPIKCLDLDDTNGQLQLEGRLSTVLVFNIILYEEPPFYWALERWGTVLLSKFGRGLIDFFIYIQNLCWSLVGVSFYGPSSTWGSVRPDQFILLVRS